VGVSCPGGSLVALSGRLILLALGASAQIPATDRVDQYGRLLRYAIRATD
jgi:hypothetical protein